MPPFSFFLMPATVQTPLIKPKPAARRGRPVAPVYSVAEVALITASSEAKVTAALDLDKSRLSFFPGAWRENDAWRIPERDVRKLVGPGLPRLLSVAEFAALTPWRVQWIYTLIKKGVLASRDVLGQVCIPETAYWALPAERPACLPARPLSFSDSPTDEGGEG